MCARLRVKKCQSGTCKNNNTQDKHTNGKQRKLQALQRNNNVCRLYWQIAITQFEMLCMAQLKKALCLGCEQDFRNCRSQLSSADAHKQTQTQSQALLLIIPIFLLPIRRVSLHFFTINWWKWRRILRADLRTYEFHWEPLFIDWFGALRNHVLVWFFSLLNHDI